MVKSQDRLACVSVSSHCEFIRRIHGTVEGDMDGLILRSVCAAISVNIV